LGVLDLSESQMNFGFIICGALLDKGGVLFFAVTYGLSIDFLCGQSALRIAGPFWSMTA